MSNKSKQLEKAITCSEAMLKDAEAGNWDNVIGIEAQRSELLEKLFSSHNQDNTIDEMDDKIRKIIDINKKLEAITLDARESASKDMAAINKGRQAVDLYAQNSI